MMNEQSGYIYLIKAGNHYKIGKSINVAQRLRQFQLPIPVELLHTIAVPDMCWAEKYLHRRFKAQRVHGEWFTLSPDDIAAICSLETIIEPEPEPEPQPEPPQTSITYNEIMPEDKLYGASAAAEYLGISVARLNEIRTTRVAANQAFGEQIEGGCWVYRQSELDAYKAQREERPKGGRPKSESPIPSPVIVA